MPRLWKEPRAIGALCITARANDVHAHACAYTCEVAIFRVRAGVGKMVTLVTGLLELAEFLLISVCCGRWQKVTFW